MKTIVVYYSNKGSNQFLAEKIARELDCDLEAIRPRLDAFFLNMTGLHLGIRRMEHRIDAYDRVILCGPIWMGQFISPLRSFANRYKDQINQLVFVTCCGSSFEGKDEKFGHASVFKKVESILGEKLAHCQAFPVGLVMPEDQREDPEAFMKVHLNDENFKGEILEIFDTFMENVIREGEKEVVHPM